MRVTGGELASRRLFGPSKRMPLRPTPDSLRERAFSILGPAISGAAFLDLFAGSGAVGIEALSRGARQVHFVETHRAAAALIRRNLETLRIPREKTRISCHNAERAIGLLARRSKRFSFLWADPPFSRWELGLDAIGLALKSSLLETGALLMLECPDHAVISALPAGLELAREVSAGASRLLFFRTSDTRRSNDA